MRGLSLLAMLVTMGCASQSETMFTHQGQVMAQANGLVLSEDGREGMAGMFGTTCVFNATNGQMGEDFDLEGEDESVEDSSSSGIVLTRSERGIHEVAPYGNGFDESDAPPTWQTNPGDDSAFVSTELEGVLAARWLGDVPVALAYANGECALHRVAATITQVSLDVEVCTGYRDMVVKADTQEVLVGSTSGIVSISDDSVASWSASSVEAMSWDGSTSTMYVMRDGGQSLQALNVDGTVRWAHSSVGGVVSLTHMGPMGAVATMENDGAGRGLLAVYDGQTGAVIEAVGTPSAGSHMAISANGETLAIAVDQFIHLFSVNR